MLAIRGHYDGKVVVLDEPPPVSPQAEVLILFKENKRQTLEEARAIRNRLRGSGKGFNLVEKLLIDRKQDG